jgi:predicted nucleic acid-binding protein
MIHLDTNFLIQALRPGTAEEAQLRQWLTSGEPLGLSVIVWAEFLCGPLTAGDEILAETLFPVIEELLSADARKGAELFNNTGRRSRSLADCLIAAVALRCDAETATANRADFEPFQTFGLRLT